MRTAVGIFLIIVGFVIAMTNFAGEDKERVMAFFSGTIASVFFFCGFFIAVSSPITTEYVPAEIVATNNTSTYFGTADGHIYHAQTLLHDWPDDVPYLLYVEKNGTDSRYDDEILVVWRAD